MKMIKKISVICIVSIFLIIGAISIFNKSSKPDVRAEILKSEKGWAYNIKFKNKTFIHQTYIPAIQGNQYFKSENDAKKVASLVLSKLESGKLPTVSIREVDSLKIKYDSF